MHSGTLKKLALALTFWLALHLSPLKAQIFGPYGTSPTVVEADANGLFFDTGTFGTGTLSLSGGGTRMIWYPGKGAFRAGTVTGSEWDDTKIGQYSSSLGVNNTASGYGSVALGGFNNSTNEGTTSFGGVNSATGMYSTVFGGFNTASGYAATAFGGQCIALGDGSTASGFYTSATAYLSFTLGTYNVGGGSHSAWVDTDPLFEIGNGTAATHSDAFVVYKNGDTTAQGKLTVGGVVTAAPGGDIPMYTGE